MGSCLKPVLLPFVATTPAADLNQPKGLHTRPTPGSRGTGTRWQESSCGTTCWACQEHVTKLTDVPIVDNRCYCLTW